MLRVHPLRRKQAVKTTRTVYAEGFALPAGLPGVVLDRKGSAELGGTSYSVPVVKVRLKSGARQYDVWVSYGSVEPVEAQ